VAGDTLMHSFTRRSAAAAPISAAQDRGVGEGEPHAARASSAIVMLMQAHGLVLETGCIFPPPFCRLRFKA